MRKIKYWLQLTLASIFYLSILFYALIFTNETGWTLWVFATLLLFTEIVSLLGSLKRIKLVSQATMITSVGEPTIIEFFLQKKKAYPLWFIKLQFTYTQLNLVTPIYFYRGEQRQIENYWIPEERGYFTKTELIVTSSDLFDWLKKERKVQIPINYYVLPKKHEKASQLATDFQRSFYQNQVGETSFSLKNYRPYQAGDSIKQIDWKLSSRQSDFMFREYQLFQEAPFVLLFYGQESLNFEDTLSLFYSLQEYLGEKNYHYLAYGSQIDISKSAQVKDYACIQPLVKDQALPLLIGKKLIVFAPEISTFLHQEISRLGEKQQVTLYVYNNVKQQMEEVR